MAQSTQTIVNLPVYNAASEGDDTALGVLLMNPLVSVNWRNAQASHRTALGIAAENGHRSTVCLLLAAGANVDLGMRPADFNPLLQSEATPVRMALMHEPSHDAVVRVLLSNNAYVDAGTVGWACRVGSRSIGALLRGRQHLANVESSRTYEGELQMCSPVLHAILGEQNTFSTVTTLMSNTAYVSAQELAFAAMFSEGRVIAEMLRWNWRRPALGYAPLSLDTAFYNGMLPIHHAATSHNLSAMSTLIEMNANLHLLSAGGGSALAFAQRSRDVAMVRLISSHL